MTETLDDLLNKVEAIFDCGAGKPKELAAFMDERPQRVSEWIRGREWKPSGEATLKIQQWAANMMIRIAKAGSKLQTPFRNAYRDVTEKRRGPSNGKD